MQTALMPVGTLRIAPGDTLSNIIGLEAYADAEFMYIGSASLTAGLLTFLDPEFLIPVGVYDFGSPIVTVADGMIGFQAPAGYGLQINGNVDAAEQLYIVWKRCLIG